MIRRLIVLVMLIGVVTSAFAADPAFHREGLDEEGAEFRTGHRHPMPTQEVPLLSIIGTGSMTVGTTTAVVLPTLGTYTREVWVGAIGGAVNYGPSTVPEGTAYPFYIASGAYQKLEVATRTFKMYFRGQTATTTVDRMEW